MDYAGWTDASDRRERPIRGDSSSSLAPGTTDTKATPRAWLSRSRLEWTLPIAQRSLARSHQLEHVGAECLGIDVASHASHHLALTLDEEGGGQRANGPVEHEHPLDRHPPTA